MSRGRPVALMTVHEYYSQPAVRSRIAEYCGADGADAPTCRYLVGLSAADGYAGRAFPSPRSLDSLGALLAEDDDVCRSVWDRGRLLVTLDLEYCSFDYRGEPFVNPQGAFGRLEPTYHAVEALCDELGLEHKMVVTGQGYHAAWYLDLGAQQAVATGALGRVAPSLWARYATGNTPTGEPVDGREARVFAGVGMLVEWLAHLLCARASAASPAPVVCLGLEVGNRGAAGREAISIDLSEYADPLDRRYTRCAFSAYQKHRSMGDIIGWAIADATPPKACVPRPRGAKLEETLAVRDDLAAAAELAKTVSARIPDATAGVGRLLESYRRSKLAEFHEWYYRVEPDPPPRWPASYDRLELGPLPPCVALPLAHPNDLLLKPANIQNTTRVLWALGWHPRHIAGLIQSKYERDWGWGQMWLTYDAATRADVYVRILSGLVATGTDDLRDFNCVSHQERGHCPQPFCGHNLADYASALQGRLG